MNKEKILNKIGALIDKAELTEEDLAKFFQNDEEPKPTETETEEPKPNTEEAVKAESEDGGKVEEEVAPEDEKPEGETEEEPKTSSEAVPEETPETANDHVTKDEVMKLIEGYKAEVDSLRQALEKANVLQQVTTKGTKQVGVGTTSTSNLKKQESTMDDTIAKLNRGRR
jgi:hypothetical protein